MCVDFYQISLEQFIYVCARKLLTWVTTGERERFYKNVPVIWLFWCFLKKFLIIYILIYFKQQLEGFIYFKHQPKWFLKLKHTTHQCPYWYIDHISILDLVEWTLNPVCIYIRLKHLIIYRYVYLLSIYFIFKLHYILYYIILAVF